LRDLSKYPPEFLGRLYEEKVRLHWQVGMGQQLTDRHHSEREGYQFSF